MARLPRYVLPGHPQHIIQRGNNRCPIFHNDYDYQYFKNVLADALEQHNCELHAYVLMTNHVHLLMTPHSDDGLGMVMQSVGRKYVRYFNDSYERSGALWDGRYRSTLIDSNRYLLICYRYIELNPVRASMVEHPRYHPWSSYEANAMGKHDPLLTEHPLYTLLGRTAVTRQAAYRAMFKNHLKTSTLEAIREATNKAWVLGNEHFQEEIENLLQRRTQPMTRGGDRRSHDYKQRR